MKKNNRSSLQKHWDFILADAVIIEISYLFGCILWGWINHRSPKLGVQFRHDEVMLLLSVFMSVLIGSPYKNILKRNKYQEISACAKHTFILLIIFLFLAFFTHESGSVSRLTVFLTWVIYFLMETAFRLVWKRLLRQRFIAGKHQSGKAMILLTERDFAQDAIRGLSSFYAPYFIAGVFLEDKETVQQGNQRAERVKKDIATGRAEKGSEGAVKKIEGIPILGNIQDAIHYASNHWVDEVVIGFPDKNSESVKEIAQHFELMGIKTHRILLELPEAWHTGEASVERYGNFLVTTRVLRYVPTWKWAVKRAADIVGGIVGLAITGVVFIFVAPRIYHADKGPVIYTSTRIGKNGKPFRFYKFRSMYQDADQRKEELMKQNKMQGLMFKVDNDPRILPGIGEFIRKTSLDEFPQFWNVLKGDMSLVGTRPPTQDEWEQYSEEHRIRMTQRPGITGIWQVSGRSEITDFSEVVRMDERYIETWTIGMDVSILWKTVVKVFRKEGAE